MSASRSWSRRWAFRDEAARGWIPWTVLLAIIAPVIFVVLASAGVLPILVAGVVRGMSGRPAIALLASANLFYSLFVVFGVIILGVIAWVKLAERRSLASMGFAGPRRLAGFAKGFAGGLASVAVAVGSIWALGGVTIVSGPSAWSDPGALMWIGIFLLGFMVQGSAEETFFRGWLMSAISARAGIIFGVLINAFWFGLLHSLNTIPPHAVGVANVVLVGFFLSFWALAEGSILSACGWHAGWNWFLATGFDIELSGMAVPVEAWAADLDTAGPELISGGVFGPEGSLVTTGVLGVLTLWAFLRLRRRLRES